MHRTIKWKPSERLIHTSYIGRIQRKQQDEVHQRLQDGCGLHRHAISCG